MTVEGENNQNQSVNTEKSESSKNNLPVQVGSSNQLQVREKVSIAGLRPIAVSNLQVVETVNIMGIRPITANTIDIVETINVSGIRPIAASALVISDSYSVMGNRPVASNIIDDSEYMMGFLD
jgi:hypothetical protein